VSVWLLRTAVNYLIEICPVLLAIAAIALASIIAWRAYKHFRDLGGKW